MRSRLILILPLSVLLFATSQAPAHADPLLFTLSGVTFEDGAIAVGSFVFDPDTQTYGQFDITTGVGVTLDNYMGHEYSPVLGYDASFSDNSPSSSTFAFFIQPAPYLNLVSDPITGPGSFNLHPGQSFGFGSFSGSGEFVDDQLDARMITDGSLVVTSLDVAAVPEPSTWTVGILVAMALPILERRRLARRRATGRNSAVLYTCQ